MPKRVLDFDALWASDKLASCAEWAQSEYAWLYGLADASGSFEMTNLRVIWGRVAAIRKSLTIERLQEIFDEFIARGLLFTWEENAKRYGHWTGSDVPGRLPAPSWRARLEKLAPPVPRDGLAAYSAGFGGSKEGIVARASGSAISPRGRPEDAHACELKHELEEPQAQDWDLSLDMEKNSDLERQDVCPPQRAETPRALGIRALPNSQRYSHGADSQRVNRREETPRESMPAESATDESMIAVFTSEMLLEIYDRERGELPAAGGMTPERRKRCERWLAAGLTLEEFTAAVRCAAATPFLAGDGDRGWRANFDWLIANCHNVRKVLEGEYAPHGRERAGKSRTEKQGPADLYAGMAPRPGDCGVRVNPAALARIRARQGKLLPQNMQGHRAVGAPELSPLRARDKRALENSELEPKAVGFDAQPRASPVALE
jgi:hypothetical protein